MSDDTAVVEVSQLSRSFGQTDALKGVNFQAVRGQVYGLVGANGAGKTTMIKHIMGLLRCESGSVTVFGDNPVQNPEKVLKRIGYLSEERDIPDWMSIGELMDYSQAFHANWDESYANELLAGFSLGRSKKIAGLSKGMRAQVALVAAVAHRPELLILDEPSSGLDAAVRMDILNAIVRTISEEGRTVIFSSHLLDEVERLSDQVTMINDGRVVLSASLEKLKQQHVSSTVVFTEEQPGPPDLSGTLLVSGAGRSWSVVHDTEVKSFDADLLKHDAKLVETRPATVEEIFLARVGRIEPSSKEAA